jgi:hypothetical protein
VRQHFLAAYLEALGSILLAQLFRYRALEGGLKGVKLLSRCPHICRLLSSVGGHKIVRDEKKICNRKG